MARLTPKRRKFIEEYLKCWNGAEAARRAGYKNPAVMSCRLIKVNIVAAEIDKRIRETAMSADEVLHRLADQARADISRFVTETGAIDWQAVQEQGHLIRRISHNRGRNSSIEVYDAQGALALLAKHLELTPDQLKLEQKTRAEDLTDDELAVIAAGRGARAAETPGSS